MLEKLDLILRVLDKGKIYLSPIISFLVGLHFKQPRWMKSAEQKPEQKTEQKPAPAPDPKTEKKLDQKPVKGSKR